MERSDLHQEDESVSMASWALALPSYVVGSSTLDSLVETARLGPSTAAESTLRAFAKALSHFARWCQMRGAASLRP